MPVNRDPVTELMVRGVADGVFPGAVLLFARRHEILYHRAFGVADLRTRHPVATDAVFDLASLTKPLATAMAMLVLVQEQKLHLNTCLEALFPSTKNTPKAKITLDMLLRHTSGLPAHREYFKMIAGRPDPLQALQELILAEPLEDLPGRCEVYSDLGYMLLAGVIEAVTQIRLDRFVRNHVYAPLGIEDLFFIDLEKRCPPVNPERLVSTRDCPWRGRVLTGEVEDENAWVCGGVQGHAGLFGTAGAIHALCVEIMGAIEKRPVRVLNPSVAAAFIRKHPGRTRVAGFDTPSKTGSAAGHYFSSRTVGHLGFTGTSFWMDPKTGLMVILLTNRVHPSRSVQKIKQFRPALHDCISEFLKMIPP
jgi:serine-type D-Ala-D-Ala carboxypeptidase